MRRNEEIYAKNEPISHSSGRSGPQINKVGFRQYWPPTDHDRFSRVYQALLRFCIVFSNNRATDWTHLLMVAKRNDAKHRHCKIPLVENNH